MKSRSAIVASQAQSKITERLTAVFEGIASAGIAKTRDRTLTSQSFFRELWAMYASLRINPDERLMERSQQTAARGKQQAYLLVTSDSGLAGDLNQGIVETALRTYHPKSTDLFVIGKRGASLLAERGIKPTGVFAVPSPEQSAQFAPVAQLISAYPQPTAFFQTYKSLAQQNIARMDLITVVRALGSDQLPGVISTQDYVFEPSIDELALILEGAMIQIALAEILLESRLATYAARFKAMSLAHQRAEKISRFLRLSANRAKRAASDKRQSESVIGLKVYAEH